MNMFRAGVVALAVVGIAAGASGSHGVVNTVPGELSFLPGGAHPQGATCSESAIYVSYSGGIMKFGWDGRLLKRCAVMEHLGDIAYAEGRIYGVFAFAFGTALGKHGVPVLMVGVWNENLDFLGARTYDSPEGRGLDGAVVLGDTLYTCVDNSGAYGNYRDHPPHRDTTVMMVSTNNLALKKTREIVLDNPIHYCPQALGTDGENLLFVSYGALRDGGSYPCYTRLTPDLRQIGKSGTFKGQWGFCRVPESVAGSEAPVFFTVHAVDFHKWGDGPGAKPSQLQFRFHSYDKTTGEMRDITDYTWKPPSGGFWRIARHDNGRWWAVSPDGRKTFLRGVDHVNWEGHWCEELGTRPYRDEMEKIFASRSEWVEQTLGRLRSWGFNALGSGCSPELRGRGLAHCDHLKIGESFSAMGGDHALCAFEGVPGSAFPNVFHPEFEKFCNERAAKLCATQKDDRSLFGYFFDNELAWSGRGTASAGLYDATAKVSMSHSAKVALYAFLKKQGISSNLAEVSDDVKLDFIRLVAQRYFETISKAIRRHDPNHLLLGCRFAGLNTAHKVVWEEAGKVCDVVTFNKYPWVDLDSNIVYTSRTSGTKVRDAFAERYAWTKKPMLITEWSFIALDSGLPCTGGYGQRFRTQRERVKATDLCARTFSAMPFVIGYDYFMWVDEPALGISRKFPENSNYGLVNESGEPYDELVSMFSGLNRETESIHAKGETPLENVLNHADRERNVLFPSGAIMKDEPKAKFMRKDNDYMISSSSGIVLKGKIGGRFAVESVMIQGLECGPFTFMLYHGGWQDIEQVEKVEWLAQNNALRISGSGRAGAKAFTITCDVVLFPTKPWFACNVVDVANIGTESISDLSVWLRQYSTWAKDTGSINGCKVVPDLWKAPSSAVWIRNQDGIWCGAATFARTVRHFKYWVSRDGAIHPDAAFAGTGGDGKPLRLAAGEHWQPHDQMWMIMASGKGGVSGWSEFLKDFSDWHQFNSGNMK